LLNLCADEADAMMRTAHRVAQTTAAFFDPPGLTLLQTNSKEGEQAIFHMTWSPAAQTMALP
jgi:histidine triad (HIT) family protein